MNKILSNKYVQWFLILAVGVAIGAVFYPSKTIDRSSESHYKQEIQRLQNENKKIQSKYSLQLEEEKRMSIQYQKSSSEKISSLKQENTQLKQRVKERKIKIVKPDGTIMEETYKESETELISKIVTDIKKEYNDKVSSIENKWQSIHEKRVKSIKEQYSKKIEEKDSIIASLKKEETIKVNQRKFGIAAGVMSNGNYYSNTSYDVFGPMFLNLQLQSNKSFNQSSAGFGLGIRF